LLTGQKPVEGDTLERLVLRHFERAPEARADGAGGRSGAHYRSGPAVHREETGSRPRSFTEVIAELERVTRKEAVPAPTVARRPVALIGVVIAVVLLVAGRRGLLHHQGK